jgi:hypothetical protein
VLCREEKDHVDKCCEVIKLEDVDLNWRFAGGEVWIN